MKEDMKNFYMAIVLSALVILGVNFLFPKPQQSVNQPQETVITPQAKDTDTLVTDEAENNYLPSKQILENDARLQLQNSAISGSIRLSGGRFDNIILSKYKQTLDADSPNVELMAPAKSQFSYFADYGWLSADSSIKLPSADTLWTVVGNQTLTPTEPVTLEWDNGEGLKFINKISLDDNYLFNIEQIVENNTGKSITLIPYGLFSKHVDEENMSRSVVHQGFTGIIDGDLKEIKYSSIKEEPQHFKTDGGWISFSDKYWFSAFIFADNAHSDINLRKVRDGLFQLDFKGTPLQIQSNASASVKTGLFTGAKEIKLLDKYSKDIKKFDLNVDFGWYYFITKPFFYILDFLYGFIGNMGWAILLFAAILRLLMFPIANKSYESMSKMKKIQPKIMAMQEIYKDDKMALQRATMELYKKEKVNPASGCLPLFIQIPIFFSLYKVLNIAIEIRHAPFIGWVKDLSAPDPLTISSWTHIYIPSAIDVGMWPLIYGLTMVLQNQLNPKPANKDQARMFALMPIIFTLMFAHFAVGLVIYWTLNNVLSLIQQKIIMYKNGVK